MNRHRSTLFILVFTGLLFIGCSEEESLVVIFHTNDTHSALDKYPEVAWLINNERESGNHVMVVSAGDIFAGNPVVDFHDPPGYPKIDIMNRVGYTVNTIGNHEFDFGTDVLDDRMRQAEFPFILANLDTRNSSLPQPDPYLIARAGSVRIAFLGLVQVNASGIPSTHPDMVEGIEFFRPIEHAASYSHLSRKSDAVIALTHIGFSADTLLASKYPWLDAIIGGHSHTLITSPRQYNGVWVMQAGSDLRHIGKVVLRFRGRQLVEIVPGVIHVASIREKDENIARLVEEYNDNPFLNREIGRLIRPISGKPALGSFITHIYREYGDLDLAFHNFGGIRVNRLEGVIRPRDILEMDPFRNQLVRIDLTYGELQELITNSLSVRHEPSVQISGGWISVNTEGGIVKSVSIFDEEGNELEHGRKFSTGMPDYMASAFDFSREDPVQVLGITTAEVVINYISEKGEIDFEPPVREDALITAR